MGYYEKLDRLEREHLKRMKESLKQFGKKRKQKTVKRQSTVMVVCPYLFF